MYNLWGVRGVGARGLVRSGRLSVQHGGEADPGLPPILASHRSAIWRGEDARIVLGGTLFLGADLRPGPELDDGRIVIRVGKGGRLTTNGTIHLSPGAGISIGPDASVTIGTGTHIGPNTRILSQDSIEIGAYCAISWDVQIMDFDAHHVVVDGYEKESSGHVRIEDSVWIGAGVRILKGVTLGKGSVVGAGSVVVKDVPPGAMAAGSPARVVLESVEWW